jgi:quercetin dioxygenase-like cupin family protein
MIKHFTDTMRLKEAKLKNGDKLGGVEFSTLAVGEKGMVTIMYYKKGSIVPFHSHPHEQLGYVVEGKLKVTFGEEKDIIVKKDSYAIAGNINHSLEAIEDSIIIDVFVPIREEYLDK